MKNDRYKIAESYSRSSIFDKSRGADNFVETYKKLDDALNEFEILLILLKESKYDHQFLGLTIFDNAKKCVIKSFTLEEYNKHHGIK